MNSVLVGRPSVASYAEIAEDPNQAARRAERSFNANTLQASSVLLWAAGATLKNALGEVSILGIWIDRGK